MVQNCYPLSPGRSLLQLDASFCGFMTTAVSCGQATSASCASTTGCALDSGACELDSTQYDMAEVGLLLADANFVAMTAMTTSCEAKSATQCSADIKCDFEGSCGTGPYVIFWLIDKCPTMATVIAKMFAAEGITQAQVQFIALAAGFTISTEFQAEMDAQGVWSAFQTDEIICTHAYDWLTCDELETEATCTANTECVWDDGCELNAIDMAVIRTDYNTGVNGLESTAPSLACAAITGEAACTADTTCVWSAEASAEDTKCLPTIATADAAGTTADCPAGVRGMIGALYITEQTTCGPATASATTCTDSKCDFDVEESECEISNAYLISTMSAKCGTNGAAARSTAQAALGISSGANTAAPAMVIISALVGALAIFA